MIWQQTAPFPSTFVISPRGLWQLAKGGKVQSLTVKARPELREFINVFLAMFSGNPRELQKHFRIFLKGTIKNWTMGLIPKKKGLKKALSCLILQGKMTIQKVTLFESKGDITTIWLSKISVSSKSLSKSEHKYLSK